MPLTAFLQLGFLMVSQVVLFFMYLQSAAAPAEPAASYKLYELIINTSVVLGAAALILKQVKTARAKLTEIESIVPIIVAIGKDFDPQKGQSLKDVLFSLKTDISSLRAKTHLLLDNSPAPIFLMDKRGGVQFVNSSWTNITGLTLEHAIGFGWTSAIHDDDKTRVINEWKSVITDVRPLYIEFRFVNEQRRKIHNVRARASAVTTVYNESDTAGDKNAVTFVGQLKLLGFEDF